MTNAQIEYFRNLFFDFEQCRGYRPSSFDWELFVSENIIPSAEAFSGMSAVEIVGLAHIAYAQMEIVDGMRSELNVKVRDSENNLNNRKYNFGNF